LKIPNNSKKKKRDMLAHAKGSRYIMIPRILITTGNEELMSNTTAVLHTNFLIDVLSTDGERKIETTCKVRG